ncbi:MAG: glycosyltransferase family 2 protein [Acidobacteriota bacterium]|nr:glycosyltransferase family 2 protein [Acidobacteriota bacterium]
MILQPEAEQQSNGRALPRVLVSVLSYNSAQSTADTLRSLRQQTYPNYHLQLVNNASTDDSVQHMAREFPDLDIKVLTENKGYTGGNNCVLRQGLAEGYDYIILCNHDIEVDEHAVGHLVETATFHSDTAGVIGGLEVSLNNYSRRRQATAVATAKYSKWTARASWLSQSVADTFMPLEVSWVHGALVLFTARAIRSDVLMDEKLFMYFDEFDIGFQLREKNLRAFVDPRVVVRHKGASNDFDVREGYLMQRNRLYMVHKHGLWYHQLFYHLYAGLIELPAKVCLRSLQGHTRFARACVEGHLDAWRGRMGHAHRRRT